MGGGRKEKMELKRKMIYAGAVLCAALALTSCSTIKKNLPSAPSTVGVTGKDQLPSFSVEKRFRSFNDSAAMYDFAAKLRADGYELSEKEMKACDGRAAELLTAHLSEDLFPYAGKDVPYRNLIRLFGEGALPKTEKALSEYLERYEKALWDEMRGLGTLEGLGELSEKYSFLPARSFEAVFTSLYLRAGNVEDAAQIRSLIQEDHLTVDIINKLYWIADDAPGREDAVEILEASGYEVGEPKALTRLTEDILDLLFN